MEGKVAIVLGGGRGIGAATVETFARAGAAVTVASRTEVQIEEVAERARSFGAGALAVPVDVADTKQVQEMIQQTINAFGRIDFLINCASTIEPVGQPTWEVDPDTWCRAIKTNLIGVFLISQAVVPVMLRQGSGRILVVSSSTGEGVIPHLSAYSSAAAGVTHFTQVLAAELLGTGVTANVVYPGLVNTEILETFLSRMYGDNTTNFGLWKMYVWDPIDPAFLLLWLCSPVTARITGQIIDLDNPTVQRRLAGFLSRNIASQGVDPWKGQKTRVDWT